MISHMNRKLGSRIIWDIVAWSDDWFWFKKQNIFYEILSINSSPSVEWSPATTRRVDADILNGSCDVWASRDFLPYILYSLLKGVHTITLDSWLVYLLTATIDDMLIKHVLSPFTKFAKTWFLAQTSGSQLRCRTMLKMPWNIQKTPPKHA